MRKKGVIFAVGLKNHTSFDFYTSLWAYHFCPLNLKPKMIPRKPHSRIMAVQTPVIPKCKVIPKIYPRMTRKNHIDNKEATDVKVESPAARSADGITKLGAQKMGCPTADIKIIVSIVGIMAAGGWNSFIMNGNSGNNTMDAITKIAAESPMIDLINFLASCMFLRPIHWPTTVTIEILRALGPIWNNRAIEFVIA